MITTLSRRTSIFLVLSLLPPIPTALRAAETSLGEIATAIKDLVIFMINRGDLDAREKRKISAAPISDRMIRIAAMKRIFAEFLLGKPATMSEFSPHDQMIVDQELRRIDREIANLAEDLREIDPASAAKIRSSTMNCSRSVTEKDCGGPLDSDATAQARRLVGCEIG
jgi:hypothetical protein